MIAGSVFIGLFVLFYFLMSTFLTTTPAKQLESESHHLVRTVSSDIEDISIVDASRIDVNDLENLLNLPYEEAKSKLGISGDFCLYLEDKDGNLIAVQKPDRQNLGNTSIYYGIGNEKGIINDNKCSGVVG